MTLLKISLFMINSTECKYIHTLMLKFPFYQDLFVTIKAEVITPLTISKAKY